MGAEQSNNQALQGQQEDAYIAENYDTIGSFYDPRLGEVQILKNKNTGRELAVKSKVCLSKEELEENMQQFEEIKAISHPNVLKILDIRTTQDEGFCSQTYMVKIIFEYISMDLQQEALSRVNFEQPDQRQFFEEQELVHMLQDILSGLNYLKLQQIYHGDVTSRNVLISQDQNGNKIHKVHIPQFEIQRPKYLHYSKLLRQEDDKLYLSPELLEDFGRNSIQPEFDQEKSEIFSVGIIGLQMALLEETNSCYDLDNFVINEDTVQVKLQQIADKYSPEIGHILIHLLETDPEHRASFQEALDHIATHPYAKDINAEIVDNYYNESPETQQLMRVSQVRQPVVLQEEIQREFEQQQQQQQEEVQNQQNMDLNNYENDVQQIEQQSLQEGNQEFAQQEMEQFQQENNNQFEEEEQEDIQVQDEQNQQKLQANIPDQLGHQQQPNKNQQQQQQQNAHEYMPIKKEAESYNQNVHQQPEQKSPTPSKTANKSLVGQQSTTNKAQGNDYQLNSSLKNIDQMVKEALGRSEEMKNRYDQNQQLKSFMRDILEDEIFVPSNSSPNKKRIGQNRYQKPSSKNTNTSKKGNEGWKI